MCITSRSPTATAASSAATSRPATAGCIDVIEKELFTRQLDPQRCGRDLRRADPGRRRLHRATAGLPAGISASCATATASCWSRTKSSRGVGRTGQDVRLRARGSRARHSAHRQGPGLRHADRRHDRRKESITTWESGSHGSTFGGNPVCCAAALATLDLVEGGLMANAVAHGRAAHGRRAGQLEDKHACIGDVRGRGSWSAWSS